MYHVSFEFYLPGGGVEANAVQNPSSRSVEQQRSPPRDQRTNRRTAVTRGVQHGVVQGRGAVVSTEPTRPTTTRRNKHPPRKTPRRQQKTKHLIYLYMNNLCTAGTTQKPCVLRASSIPFILFLSPRRVLEIHVPELHSPETCARLLAGRCRLRGRYRTRPGPHSYLGRGCCSRRRGPLGLPVDELENLVCRSYRLRPVRPTGEGRVRWPSGVERWDGPFGRVRVCVGRRAHRTA